MENYAPHYLVIRKVYVLVVVHFLNLMLANSKIVKFLGSHMLLPQVVMCKL
jgi:hypothetical protein